MLYQPILDKLTALKLAGILEGLREQMDSPQYRKLSFEERFGLLLDREWTLRQQRKQVRRMRVAHFREAAVVEDLDLGPRRGLDRGQVLSLAEGQWIRDKHNLIITGPTGAGKTYLACALGTAACRNGFSVRYFQSSRLLQKLTLAHAEGSYPKFLDTLAKTQLLVIDDWLRNPLTDVQTQDLLEIVDDRYKRTSTVLASQVPVANWHERFSSPTLSDAIMDRVVHNAYRLEITGESMRKQKSLTQSGHKSI
ncbi:MAG: IS21-like element helper ATPase IstB [Candidatus Aminicenantes bacterium]|nr:IS21-like element helper ATPase IstB [Candidatus Aminicenantes bacterium]